VTDACFAKSREGHLTGQWSGWFGVWPSKNPPAEQALLSGRVPDQAAFSASGRTYGTWGVGLVAA
jgi:hypothetical protein